MIDTIEVLLQWLGAIAGLGTLAYAIINMLVAQSRPTGQVTGAARQVLRTSYLVVAMILFIILAYVIWKPLPIHFSHPVSLIFSLVGTPILVLNSGLYVWGLRTLRSNFNASSGFGVRLVAGHQLVTSPPFAYIRHPMYLGAILAFWGGLLLFRTWTMLLFAVMMVGLVYRARAEEKALALAFGSEWEAYKQHIPAWIPRLGAIPGKEEK